MNGRWLLGLLLLLVILVFATRGVLMMFALRPDSLGTSEGRLAGCPKSPNCVSTEATDAEHFIKPLQFEGAEDDAIDRLIAVATKMRGTTLILRKGGYLHFECRSRLLGFVDDLEFFVEPGRQQIQIRSASRVGYSDLGVNRTRIKKIRNGFETAMGK